MATVGRVTVLVLAFIAVKFAMKLAEALAGEWFMGEFYEFVAFTVFIAGPSLLIFGRTR